MFKNFRKLARDKSGFTLTEVMIGIMILTVAIVTASNLLVSLINTNKNNVLTLKAYYLAQEGIEAVRNIRDTNWLHNTDFKGDVKLFSVLEEDKSYAVFLRSEGWSASTWGAPEGVSDRNGLGWYSPWEFEEIADVGGIEPYSRSFALGLKDSLGKRFYSNVLPSESDADFYRHIDILDPCENGALIEETACGDFILVRSVVNWRDGAKERDLTLETVLSDWKGGAL